MYDPGGAPFENKVVIDIVKLNPKNEYEISEYLYNKRKEGINFFRNSFDYISAFDSNAAIIHYKPLPKKSLSSKNRNILLIDSGAQYLEGTTDVTRVVKIGTKNLSRIKQIKLGISECTLYSFIRENNIKFLRMTF